MAKRSLHATIEVVLARSRSQVAMTIFNGREFPVLFSCCFAVFIGGEVARSQVVPDSSLDTESAIVSPTTSGVQIDGGAVRGHNLFHSFETFSVPTGTEAFFNNSLEVQNIFSRITGNSISTIDGLLSANGTANLFLLNPNGIIFGPNAQLNIGGSFLASSANSIQFADGIEFGIPVGAVREPPLLSVNVPIGLQFGENPGAIAASGTGLLLPDFLGNFDDRPLAETISMAIEFQRNLGLDPTGLRVANGQTLALVGSGLDIRGGLFKAASGRIELGSVAAGETVEIANTNSGWQLSYETVEQFGDIEISDRSLLLTSGESGGTIQIQGETIDISGRSSLLGTTLGSENSAGIFIGGDRLTLRENAGLTAGTLSQTGGNAGDIRIVVGAIEMSSGSGLDSSTFGIGNAGTVTIEATESAMFVGMDTDRLPTAVSTSVLSNARGNAGDVIVRANTVEVRDGALLFSSTAGDGNAGTVTVEATETAIVSGTTPLGRPSSIFSNVGPIGRGDAGDVRIIANTVEVSNGAVLDSSIFGEGNGGTVTVEAAESVIFSGVNPLGFNATFPVRLLQILGFDPDDIIQANVLLSRSSGALSQVNFDGRGNAGDITIVAPIVEVRDGAQLSSGTAGEGNAGTVIVEARDRAIFAGMAANGDRSGAFSTVDVFAIGNGGDVEVRAGTVSVSGGAVLNSSTFGTGNAGAVRVDASEIARFDGSVVGSFPSGAFSSSVLFGRGDAGNVEVRAGTVVVTNGAQLNSSTLARGNAGTVTVEADDRAIFAGTSSDGFPSGAFTVVSGDGVGNAGNIIVRSPSVDVINGGELSSSTFGNGDAGTVTIDAGEVTIDGSEIGSVANGSAIGNAGSIAIVADGIFLNNEAQILTSTEVTAVDSTAGNVVLNADAIELDDRSAIAADTTGLGGNIEFNSGTVLLRDNSNIRTNATGEFPGGDIAIDTDTLVALDNSDITANSANAAGGNVIIEARGIFGTEFRPFLTPESDITATGATQELQGTVQINTPDIDATSGLIDLPTTPVDVASLIDRDPCLQGQNSQFIITGRGGLPPTPFDVLGGNAGTAIDWVDAYGLTHTNVSPSPPPPISPSLPREARSWHMDDRGKIVLIAEEGDRLSFGQLDLCHLRP